MEGMKKYANVTSSVMFGTVLLLVLLGAFTARAFYDRIFRLSEEEVLSLLPKDVPYCHAIAVRSAPTDTTKAIPATQRNSITGKNVGTRSLPTCAS